MASRNSVCQGRQLEPDSPETQPTDLDVILIGRPGLELLLGVLAHVNRLTPTLGFMPRVQMGGVGPNQIRKKKKIRCASFI